MKIVSFNVNSVRLRLHQLEALTASLAPDVIGLQETKVVDEDFPVDAIREMGYEAVWFGQKTHYGVALLSKWPLSDVSKGFRSDDDDAQKRLISATVTAPGGQTVRVLNGYFPQGENRSHPVKFPAKKRFYADLRRTLQRQYKPDTPLVLMGDFNVAPVDADLGIGADNVKRWLRNGTTCFLPEERDWFDKLISWGLTDTYRQLYPQRDDRFSWFDYRSKGFDREPRRGLRIDHLLCTAPLAAALTGAGIDYDIRAMEKPSDHCPVWAEFDLDQG